MVQSFETSLVPVHFSIVRAGMVGSTTGTIATVEGTGASDEGIENYNNACATYTNRYHNHNSKNIIKLFFTLFNCRCKTTSESTYLSLPSLLQAQRNDCLQRHSPSLALVHDCPLF